MIDPVAGNLGTLASSRWVATPETLGYFHRSEDPRSLGVGAALLRTAARVSPAGTT
jgi:hypothetical protein